MSGYVYIRNWDRFQHYKDRRPAWIKLYVDLLGDDDWLALSSDDRVLLMTIWMLAAAHGNGRLRADQAWLMAQAKLPIGKRSRNLERLSDAGFIEVRASKPLAEVLAKRTIETETEQEADKGLDISKNRSRRAREAPVEIRATRNSKHAAALAGCRRLAQQYAEAGEPPERIREWLENEYRHDPSIVTEAIGAA